VEEGNTGDKCSRLVARGPRRWMPREESEVTQEKKKNWKGYLKLTGELAASKGIREAGVKNEGQGVLLQHLGDEEKKKPRSPYQNSAKKKELRVNWGG